MKRNREESILQEHFCRWLDTKCILYNASMAGVNLGIRTAVAKKRMGCKKGFPDIFIYQKSGNYAGFAIELKINNKPTPEQLEWQKALKTNGYASIIMPKGFDFSQAFNFLRTTVENYMHNNP